MKAWTANVFCGTYSGKVGRLMYCTVLSRFRERLDSKCTVWNRFRKCWTAYVLYRAEHIKGKSGLEMYCAQEIQEKLDG